MAAVLAMIWSNIRRLGDEPTKDVRVMIYVVLAMMALPLAMSIAIGARAVMTWRKPPSRRRDSRRP